MKKLFILGLALLISCSAPLNKGTVIKKKWEEGYTYQQQIWVPCNGNLTYCGTQIIDVPEKFYLGVDGIFGENNDARWVRVTEETFDFFEVGDSVYSTERGLVKVGNSR